MNTAALPPSASDNFSFYFPTSDFDPRVLYNVFMHFAELEHLQSNQFREFDFFIDGNYVSGPFSPTYLSADTIVIESALNGRDQHTIDLRKTESSTLRPMLNAKETFILRPLSAIPTDDKEGKQ